MDVEDYHFKFKISILGKIEKLLKITIYKGDKNVGKTSFLEAITSSFGKIVESEQSEELSIKVFLIKNTILKFTKRQLDIWMTTHFIK